MSIDEIIHNEDEGFTLKVSDFDDKNISDYINKLKPEHFSYLGKWQIRMFKEGYGVAYRIGTIEGQNDTEGDPTEFVVHYFHPLANRGRGVSNDEMVDIKTRLKEIVTNFTQGISAKSPNGNCISLLTPAPDYMIEELQQDLK